MTQSVETKGKVLVCFSMGLDSTTLAYHFHNAGHPVTLAYFDDGPWNDPSDALFEPDRPEVMDNFMAVESDFYAHWHAKHAGFSVVKLRYPQLNALHARVPSDNDKAEFAENLGLHYWVGFKQIMAMILLSHGAAFNYSEVVFGHLISDTAYFDETPEPFQRLQELMTFTYGGRVMIPELRNPYCEWYFDKAEVLAMALQNKVPLDMTYSCRRTPAIRSTDGTNRYVACGKCENCIKRLEAFAKNGTTDPALYDVT